MPDIWSGIGNEISQGGEGDWLYKVAGSIRGPVPMQAVAQKLVRGEIDLNTYVAREGGEFHPIARVAAFAQHITEAKKQAQKRAAAKSRRLVVMLALPALAVLAGAGYVVYRGVLGQRAEQARLRSEHDQKLALERERIRKMKDPELVALVSFGGEDSVKIRKAASEGKKATTAAKKVSGAPPVEEMVEQCKLSQADILGTLKRNLAKINVCVEDERSRDKQGLLPPMIELEFIVVGSGKVTEFAINDRHYRKGPLNNCMTKVFNGVQFPASNGANCPVSIPLKIGK